MEGFATGQAESLTKAISLLYVDVNTEFRHLRLFYY